MLLPRLVHLFHVVYKGSRLTLCTARMLWGELREIPYYAVDDQPAALCGGVLLQLIGRNHGLFGHYDESSV